MNTQPQINLEQRKQLISNYKLFVLLSPNDIAELANLMQEVHFSKDEIIVKEGDLIDAFFIIASGQADVIKETKTQEGTQILTIATLHEGESIGLSTCGIFSATCERSATIRAKTDVILLKIDITQFNNFISAPSRLYPQLREASEHLAQATKSERTGKKLVSAGSGTKKSFWQKIKERFI